MEVLDLINNYWGIIITVSAVIASFAVLKYQNTEQEERIDRTEKSIENLNTMMADRNNFGQRLKALEEDNKCIKTSQQSIDAKLASIQTDILWLKEYLSKK
jgi:uncharacterized membrane protein